MEFLTSDSTLPTWIILSGISLFALVSILALIYIGKIKALEDRIEDLNFTYNEETKEMNRRLSRKEDLLRETQQKLRSLNSFKEDKPVAEKPKATARVRKNPNK